MCYVSAEGRSRDAKEDEVLVVSRQPHDSNWLVSPDDPSTAVCLKEGTQVELLYIPEKTQRKFGFPPETQATFKMEKWWRRDLFVLRDGRKVELRKLQPGQVVRVLSVRAAANQEEILPGEQRTDSMVEGGRIRRQIFKRYSSGVPVHWCL
jgi:hypothetical protein